MDIGDAIREEQERRKADKQYQALNRAYLKSQLRVIPGGKAYVSQKRDKREQ